MVNQELAIFINFLFLTFYVVFFADPKLVWGNLLLFMITLNAIINMSLFYSRKTTIQAPVFLLSATMLVLVSLPTYGFLFGDQTTLLERIGYIGVFDDLLIVRALSIISISHAGYVLGILLGTQKTSDSNSDSTSFFTQESEKFKIIWKILSIIGLLGALFAALSTITIESRGNSGQGVPVLLLHGWMIAPALAVLFRHWGQKPLMLITLLQIALLLQIGGARSSLTLIFLSVFIRLSKNSKIGVKSNRIKEIATISIVIYFILIVIQAIPVLREEIRNERISPSTYVGILRDPLTNLTSVSGFDSVQGAILAINAKNSGFEVSPLDPFKAFSTFVPRQIWPNKPLFIGPELTQTYSRVQGNAGIVISGGAYLYLIGSSSLLVLGFFFILGRWTARLSRNIESIIPLMFILHFVVRFTYGGDSLICFIFFKTFYFFGSIENS